MSRESRLSFDFGKEGTSGISSGAFRCFKKAKEIYAQQEILGSDDKDQINCLLFKAAGAEVDSRLQCVNDGLVSVSAPASKRLGLASLSAVASGMGYTSDAFHSSLIGSWVSVLLFRRLAMAVLNNVFKVVSSASIDQDDPRLVKLPRAAADELAVLSALAPVISSNVAVPFSDWVYATDASNSKGTVVKTRISEDVSKLLWRSADKKEKNLPLLSKAQIVLKEYDAGFEERLESWKEDEVDLGEDDQSPSRPLGLWYEFVEVCGGAGKISRELDRLRVLLVLLWTCRGRLPTTSPTTRSYLGFSIYVKMTRMLSLVDFCR